METAEGGSVILVVDDDEMQREAVTMLLQLSGYTAVGAINGEDALEILRNGLEPCLILLDLMMPVMNGWQFREAQLKDPRLAAIKTVVLSALDVETDFHGIAALLSKPVPLDELMAIVKSSC